EERTLRSGSHSCTLRENPTVRRRAPRRLPPRRRPQSRYLPGFVPGLGAVNAWTAARMPSKRPGMVRGFGLSVAAGGATSSALALPNVTVTLRGLAPEYGRAPLRALRP